MLTKSCLLFSLLLSSLCFAEDRLVSPLKAIQISSGFGFRQDPLTRETSMHEGIDIKAEPGTPVYAAGAGKVVFSGVYKGYGNLIVIRHNPELTTHYGHLGGALPKVGSRVSAGDVIGTLGRTGRATGPHLHFEIRVNGEPKDPISFFKDHLVIEREQKL